MLQHSFHHFVCTDSGNVDLPETKHSSPRSFNTHVLLRVWCVFHAQFWIFQHKQLEPHLLSPADQHRSEEAEGHPHFVQARLVICDVPEEQRAEFILASPPPVSVKTLGRTSPHLYHGYTKFSSTNSNTWGTTEEVRHDVHRTRHIHTTSPSDVPLLLKRPPWRGPSGPARADSSPGAASAWKQSDICAHYVRDVPERTAAQNLSIG